MNETKDRKRRGNNRFNHANNANNVKQKPGGIKAARSEERRVGKEC